MGDRELLELAAKAAEVKILWCDGIAKHYIPGPGFCGIPSYDLVPWSPLTDDGDALRLAVALRLDVVHDDPQDNDAWVMVGDIDCVEDVDGESSRPAATRRAIVRAAAEIGRKA